VAVPVAHTEGCAAHACVAALGGDADVSSVRTTTTPRAARSLSHVELVAKAGSKGFADEAALAAAQKDALKLGRAFLVCHGCLLIPGSLRGNLSCSTVRRFSSPSQLIP
jgi:hypothetical protein